MPFEFSCLSATERRSTGAKRDDLHCKGPTVFGIISGPLALLIFTSVNNCWTSLASIVT